MAKPQPRALALAIAGAVVVLDRITKLLIERYVSLSESLTVIPGFFDIVHAKNRGAAFGIFSDSDHPLRTALLIAVSFSVMVFVGVMLFHPRRAGIGNNKLTQVALSLVLGGAAGNLWDRVAYGMVTDFIELYLGEYRFAAFNVADSAITVGASLLLLDMWRTRDEPAET